MSEIGASLKEYVRELHKPPALYAMFVGYGCLLIVIMVAGA